MDLADTTDVCAPAACSKKWAILAVIFAIQCSMNMNAGIYASALSQYEERFNITPQYARLGQGLFLITYAIGCEA